MDLLGSILGSMQKPPSMGDAEKKKLKAQKELIQKQQEKEKKKLEVFREQIQKRIHDFIKDGVQEKIRFETMDKTDRAIVHEVADIAGLSSFSFGIEEEDRYVMIWKKEFAPSDEELTAYKRDGEWDPEKAKHLAQVKAQERLDAETSTQKKVQPNSNYKDKYKHLIGDTAAKDAAHSTVTDRNYGLVSSANKRDQRTIEQVLADTRARKKQKLEENQSTSLDDCDKIVAQSDDLSTTDPASAEDSGSSGPSTNSKSNVPSS